MWDLKLPSSKSARTYEPQKIEPRRIEPPRIEPRRIEPQKNEFWVAGLKLMSASHLDDTPREDPWRQWDVFLLGKAQTFLCMVLTALALSGCVEGDTDALVESVTAAEEGITALSITTDVPIITTGETLQFTALATLEDGGTKDVTGIVNWGSSDSALASISGSGLLSSFADGTVSISARIAEFSDSTPLTLSSAALLAIQIEAGSTVGECKNLQLTARGTFEDSTQRDITSTVIWISSVPTSATVLSDDPTKGSLSTFFAGSVMVTATRDSISSEPFPITVEDNLAEITLAAAQSEIDERETVQVTATGRYNDGSSAPITDNASWESSNTAAATVSNATTSRGLVTGGNEGAATISAACGGLTGSTSLTVRAPPEVIDLEIEDDDSTITIGVDSTFSLQVEAEFDDRTREDVTEDADWRVVERISGEAVTVSNSDGSKGEITTNGPGTSEVEAEFQGVTDTILIVVE